MYFNFIPTQGRSQATDFTEAMAWGMAATPFADRSYHGYCSLL